MQESPSRKFWISETRLGIWSMATLAVISISYALSYTKDIMIPFVFALFLYFMLLPTLRFLKNKAKFPRWLALLVTFCIVILLLVSLSLFTVSTLKSFFNSYQDYHEKVVIAVERVKVYLDHRGFNVSQIDPITYINQIPVLNILRNAGFGALNFIGSLTLVFIFLLFLFTGTTSASSKDEDIDDVSNNEFLLEIDQKIRKYLLTKLATSTLTAILVGSFLALMGLDFAFGFAILVFILNFVPTIGSLFATALPLPVALIQYDSISMVLLVLLIPGAIQFGIGSIMEPKLVGRSLQLHPVVILLSLMFWALIWGVPGAFVAVPITAILKIILEKIEGGHYISELMAGNSFKK